MTGPETGVWMLTVEHDWGSRGLRRETQYLYRTKPSDEVVAEKTGGSHYSLTHLKCGHPYPTTSYH